MIFEPDYKDKVMTESEIGNAFNWYNYNYNQDEMVGWLYSYFKNDPIYPAIKAVKSNSFPSTLCIIARLISNGAILPADMIERFNQKIKDIVSTPIVSEANSFSVSTTTVVDRVKTQVSNLISEVDEEIDKFYENKKSSFDIFEFLKSKDVAPKQAAMIRNFYQPILDELLTVLKGEDKDLNEAYSSKKKKDIVAQRDFYKSIVDGCESWAKITKAISGKPKKPPKINLKKVQFKKADESLKIVSLHPSVIIDAKKVLTYDIARRKMTVYLSNPLSEMSIKGTTILNFDETLSYSKNVRENKIATLIQDINASRIEKSIKLVENLKSVKSIVKGRLNKETLILKAVK